MATYRIKFVETFLVDIEAESDAEARQKADRMLTMPRLQIASASPQWERGWSTMVRMGWGR